MPNWAKENKYFKDTIVDLKVWDTKKNKEVKTKGPYPFIKSTAQLVYEEFMSKIINPATGEFYSQRDSNGNQIKQKDGKNAKYVVKTIVRLRRKDGKEYLYSMGHLTGFTSLGIPISRTCRKPEVHLKTIFAYDRKFNPKTQTVEDICKGPVGSEIIYDMPFTAENLEKLYSQTDEDLNLVVKDERNGMSVNVAWSNLDESKKLFKTKDFKFLYNGDYIPDAYKAEIRAKAEAMATGLSTQIPQIESNNPQNFKNYTL